MSCQRERERTNGGLFRQTKTSKNRLESKQAYIGITQFVPQRSKEKE